jgi:iron complex transport system substrate-binding protein
LRRGGLCLAAVLLLLTLALACEGGGEEPPPEASPTVLAAVQAQYPLTIVDTVGREVTIEAQPQRIASLSPAATETLFAIGAGAQVIAVDMFSNYPEEATTRQQLDAFQPNLEAIAEVQPDLVLLFYDPGELAASLERLGITTAVLGSAGETPESVEAVFDQIRLLGQMTGHSQEAEDLVAKMQARIDVIEEALADVEQGPRIFHEVDATLYTAAPDSFIGGLYKVLKAQNIAAGADQPFPCRRSDGPEDAAGRLRPAHPADQGRQYHEKRYDMRSHLFSPPSGKGGRHPGRQDFLEKEK